MKLDFNYIVTITMFPYKECGVTWITPHETEENHVECYNFLLNMWKKEEEAEEDEEGEVEEDNEEQERKDRQKEWKNKRKKGHREYELYKNGSL